MGNATSNRRSAVATILVTAVAAVSCTTDRGRTTQPASVDASAPTVSDTELAPSRVAATRVQELRARFASTGGVANGYALDAVVGIRYEQTTDGTNGVMAVLPMGALHGTARRARVALPRHANDAVVLEDETSHVAVRFTLEHAANAPMEVGEGLAVFRGALDGADVLHRVHAEGTEDFVVFETRPPREEISYSVDVSRVAGLRLVSNTLEFLDRDGTPRLRVAPPYLLDASHRRHDAKLVVGGCAYDTNPAGPWGRGVTPPGLDRCSVRVVWNGDVSYPIMVDPSWGTTGSMATARAGHTASLLLSGKVLVTGGTPGSAFLPMGSAELFDPTGNAGHGTFAATGTMGNWRTLHTATVLASGKVLVVGGRSGLSASQTATAELYNPLTGTFGPTGPLADARYGHTATPLASGKVLIAGGIDGLGSAKIAEIFDPAGNAGAGSFSLTGNMVTGRQYHSATALPSGKVLFAGGQSGNAAVDGAELFDPAADAGVGAFIATGKLSTYRLAPTGTLLPSGKVLIAGGWSGFESPTAELFDPTANAGAGSFASTGTMANGRYGSSASLLASGKVIVTGGILGLSTLVGVSEVYDPATELFSIGATMVVPRYWQTATVMPSGMVLIVGGQLSSTTYSASAELYGGAAGETCSNNNQCLSTFCVDGVCCDSACAGSCDACALSGKEGTCTKLGAGNGGTNPACVFPLVCDGVNASCSSCASDAGCAPNYFCAADGTCQPQKAQAAACNPQADCMQSGCRECTSGFCADGFCCDTPCAGTCQACAAALKQDNVADGTCGPSKDGTDPHNQCAPAGPACAADGQCDGAGACRAHTPAGVDCGKVCQGTSWVARRCSGTGVCKGDGLPVDCSPYLCENGACTITCAKTADCVASAMCKAGVCVPKATNGVACSIAEECASGSCVDGVCCNSLCDGQCEACDVVVGTCSPISGAPHGKRSPCATGNSCGRHSNQCSTCYSNDACTPPLICNPLGECVAPPASTDNAGGGCSTSNEPTRDSNGLLWIIVGLLILGPVRRYRVGRRSP